MLKGEYSHNIDAKGRLIIPAKFRDDLGEHFCEFYDVLHTHGGQWLVEEIDKMINERRK